MSLGNKLAAQQFTAYLNLPVRELTSVALRQAGLETDVEALAMNPNEEWTVVSRQLLLAENSHATETLEVHRTRRSTAFAHSSRYKGILGDIVTPTDPWAICLDDDGPTFYWRKGRHGGDARLFALAATECDEVSAESLALRMIHWYVSAALCQQTYPRIRPVLGRSSLPPLTTTLKQTAKVAKQQ